MKDRTKFLIFFYLLLILLFGFYGGKYQAWAENPDRYQTSESRFGKDWQIAMILGLIVIFGVMIRINEPTQKTT
jgi:hypothetical protein